jgi:hypothetical protein
MMLFLLFLPVLAGILLMFFFCCFLIFQSWVSCLVSNLVSPLLDGLDDLLNNGSLGDRSHWGKGIGSGFWESKTGMGNSKGGGNGSSSIGSRGISYWGSSKTSIGSRGDSMGSIWVRGSKAGVSTAISKSVSICHLGIGDSSSRGNSASKNNLKCIVKVRNHSTVIISCLHLRVCTW